MTRRSPEEKAAKQREYNKKWYEKNRKKLAAKRKKMRRTDPAYLERVRAQSREAMRRLRERNRD